LEWLVFFFSAAVTSVINRCFRPPIRMTAPLGAWLSSKLPIHLCLVLAAWRAAGSPLLDNPLFDLYHPSWRAPSSLCTSRREPFKARDRFSQLLAFQAELRKDLIDVHYSSEIVAIRMAIFEASPSSTADIRH
jgi:hypothetical protein